MLLLGRLIPRLSGLAAKVQSSTISAIIQHKAFGPKASQQDLILRNLSSHFKLDQYRTVVNFSHLVPGQLNLFGVSSQQYSNVRPDQTVLQLFKRSFHAKGSKVRYLDFRYRFNTCHLRSHLLIIRRQKMKKHKRTKWRKKFKALLAKTRLKREIAKEKVFRVELLTMIKRAEQFDPKEYALRKIKEANSVKKELTREERLEDLKELIRKNRYQVDYIKPKHKRDRATSLCREL